MSDEIDETPDPEDMALAKLDQLQGEVAAMRVEVMECLRHINRGQDTLIARVNKIAQRPRKR